VIETLALSLGLSDLSERERLRAVWVADAAPRSLSSRISHQQQDIDQESHMGAKVIDWIGLGWVVLTTITKIEKRRRRIAWRARRHEATPAHTRTRTGC